MVLPTYSSTGQHRATMPGRPLARPVRPGHVFLFVCLHALVFAIDYAHSVQSLAGSFCVARAGTVRRPRMLHRARGVDEAAGPTCWPHRSGRPIDFILEALFRFGPRPRKDSDRRKTQPNHFAGSVAPQHT